MAVGQTVGRETQIIRTSMVGIVANVALAAFKAAVGSLSSSIAIVLDAVNNLSDALSSFITILGTKLAAKAPDRNHPYGHGRAEYLTTIVIAVIVLGAGLSSLKESIERIVHPEQPSYETAMLLIIAVAVVAKIVLGRHFEKRGQALGSDTLVASGADATMDALVSSATLAAALINMFTGLSLEAWLGIAISILIIKTGIDILREALDKILGKRIDAAIATDIKKTVCGIDGVLGAYDLVLNDYGPENSMGGIHVEVDEHLTAKEIDRMTRRIQQAVFAKHRIVLHTVGIYSVNTACDAADDVAAIRTELEQITAAEPYVLQTHGLYVDTNAKMVLFDIVVSFDAPDREAVCARVMQTLDETFPVYRFKTTLDADISD
ncbi:cation transporter [Coriobacteriales bacterium OH1046]|nr:cation transporter [Coriobacteriales bacterium OH1046]